jgi:hypothetical protein
MATSDSSGVERRAAHSDGNRPRTRQQNSGWCTTDARVDMKDRIGREL